MLPLAFKETQRLLRVASSLTLYPPTNVRTRANGVIIGRLTNGDFVRVIDQIRANDGLWDFVMEESTGTNREQPLGWVYDPLIRCH